MRERSAACTPVQRYLAVERELERACFAERWITHDVIPAIRKTGMYATPATVEAMLANPDTMIQVLQACIFTR